MREVMAGDLAGAYELSFDEIDLVSGGTPEQAYVVAQGYVNIGGGIAAISGAGGFVPGMIVGGGMMIIGGGFIMGAGLGWWQ